MVSIQLHYAVIYSMQVCIIVPHAQISVFDMFVFVLFCFVLICFCVWVCVCGGVCVFLPAWMTEAHVFK